MVSEFNPGLGGCKIIALEPHLIGQRETDCLASVLTYLDSDDSSGNLDEMSDAKKKIASLGPEEIPWAVDKFKLMCFFRTIALEVAWAVTKLERKCSLGPFGQ